MFNFIQGELRQFIMIHTVKQGKKIFNIRQKLNIANRIERHCGKNENETDNKEAKTSCRDTTK